MIREERIRLAIERGYTCNPSTGEVFGMKGLIKSKTKTYPSITIVVENSRYTIYQHHFIWYWVYNKCVDYIDHIDRNPSNNSIDNLRSVSKQQNGYNRNAKGYSYDKSSGKYMSRIRIKEKLIHLGYFNTEKHIMPTSMPKRYIISFSILYLEMTCFHHRSIGFSSTPICLYHLCKSHLKKDCCS